MNISPAAIQIIDYYHAAEHIGDIARLLYSDDEVGRSRWRKRLTKALLKGKMGKVLAELGALSVRGKKKEEVEKAIANFENYWESRRIA